MKITELKEIIAENITYFREKAGLNKKQVADALGVSQPSVTHWENGSNSIDINKLIDLCKLFQCELNDMLTQRDSRKPNMYLNDSESNHLKKFRALSAENKKILEATVNVMLEVQNNNSETAEKQPERKPFSRHTVSSDDTSDNAKRKPFSGPRPARIAAYGHEVTGVDSSNNKK